MNLDGQCLAGHVTCIWEGVIFKVVNYKDTFECEYSFSHLFHGSSTEFRPFSTTIYGNINQRLLHVSI